MTLKDLKKIIEHWIQSSDYDWETALALYKSKKFPYCLFFVHLSIEKLLKALIVKETKDHAPFTHNLVYLAGKLSFSFSKEEINLLQEINSFNLESRYPDEKSAFYKKADKNYTQRYQKSSGVLREWLKKKF